MSITKKALLIGINYRGTTSELNGCINDVDNMKSHLLDHGYKLEDITILTDYTDVKPTRENMVKEILNLVMSKNSVLFLHYSGHGGWTRDLSGDEIDKRDETLIPIDYQEEGVITDDQLRSLLSFMHVDSKLTIVLDCCHSGTGMDLAYTLSIQKRVTRTKKRAVPKLSMIKDSHYSETPGRVVMLSGCQDAQTSADAYIRGNYQGAMTFCLLKALGETPKNWNEFILRIRKLLKENRYSQIAHLTSGQKLALTSAVDFC